MGIVDHKSLMLAAVSDNRLRLALPPARTHRDAIVIDDAANSMPTLIADAEVLELSGADSVTFANSQFCNDCSALGERQWQWSAWLDAQGRVRHLFALLRPDPARLLAWLPRGLSRTMAEGLARFVMRSKVDIRRLSEIKLLAIPATSGQADELTATEGGWAFSPAGYGDRGILLSTGHDGRPGDPRTREAWQLADIEAGMPWIDEAVSAEFTPQAIALDRLDAISTNKGCYPGQEVVARLHYRGGNKRACFKLRIDTRDPPLPGQAVHRDLADAPVGRVLYSARIDDAHCLALAVLPLDTPIGAGLQLAGGGKAEITGHAFTAGGDP